MRSQAGKHVEQCPLGFGYHVGVLDQLGSVENGFCRFVARPSQARDEASSDGVVLKVGNDRNGPGRLLRSFMEPTRGSGSFYRI